MASNDFERTILPFRAGEGAAGRSGGASRMHDDLLRLLSRALSEVCLLVAQNKYDRAAALACLFEAFVPPRNDAEAGEALQRLRDKAERIGLAGWLTQALRSEAHSDADD